MVIRERKQWSKFFFTVSTHRSSSLPLYRKYSRCFWATTGPDEPTTLKTVPRPSPGNAQMEKQPVVMEGSLHSPTGWHTHQRQRTQRSCCLSSSSIQLLMAIPQQYYVVLSSHLQKRTANLEWGRTP